MTSTRNIKPFLPSSRPSGPLFIGLNAVRALSIIALLLVFAADIETMVYDIKAIKNPASDEDDCDYIEYSSVPDQTGGPFWSILNRIFILFECLVLILSEVGAPRCLFETYIPILGPAYGLGCLGVFQALIGAQVLSHYCDLFPQVSSWLLFIVGCFNILVGIFLREGAKKKRLVFSWENLSSLTPQTRMAVTAWDMVTEKNGSKSPSESYKPPRVSRQNTRDSESPLLPVDSTAPGARFGGFGFGRQGEKAAADRGWKINRPVDALPRYAV
ncbi:hypothetical protein I307_03527 [Cryptococcus deuterogattii 99/473]|uniref:DUF7598 domain-containing protein n=2 Tax=Cryptococcus deuterogattii TaxID=1859096 RepID=A0A0D0V7J3_9TREE|nr:hypothetical protein CNBG_3498 [Cryptococcus deuterogattii R265]KIR30418.1 hypothetical protein I309_00555 [Cryptococcus deuterogattii LA55]KIR36920.1 hypothetical protein I352_00232 [Cryptococcus deuterogattii MMRL2647]KIR43391.1 hypothetical protein I313_00233 [Cryptococcus deuterogattii Ram5]KIR74724.1 hypothetical protein I310_00998 [Cryptococcus deuterogattii CA1014]KIR92349.1 hypothetical protein I304_03753 [Cryptococcus deuterogattii CBS 10090]KIS01515.1 hypothetical protein L804_01